MFEYNGVEYNVDTVVGFEIGRRCHVGVIMQIYRDSSNNITCSIAEPSGHECIRTLDRDVTQGSMVQVVGDEAFYMNTEQWKKRYYKRKAEQG